MVDRHTAPPSAANDFGSHTLCFKNLSTSITAADIEKLFVGEGIPNPKRLEIHYSGHIDFKGTAFARFGSAALAATAYKALGSHVEVCGRRLKVEPKKGGKKLQAREALCSTLDEAQVALVSEQIRSFVDDEGRRELSFVGYGAEMRKYIHALAETCGLAHVTSTDNGADPRANPRDKQRAVFLSKDRKDGPHSAGNGTAHPSGSHQNKTQKPQLNTSRGSINGSNGVNNNKRAAINSNKPEMNKTTKTNRTKPEKIMKFNPEHRDGVHSPRTNSEPESESKLSQHSEESPGITTSSLPSLPSPQSSGMRAFRPPPGLGLDSSDSESSINGAKNGKYVNGSGRGNGNDRQNVPVKSGYNKPVISKSKEQQAQKQWGFGQKKPNNDYNNNKQRTATAQNQGQKQPIKPQHQGQKQEQVINAQQAQKAMYVSTPPPGLVVPTSVPTTNAPVNVPITIQPSTGATTSPLQPTAVPTAIPTTAQTTFEQTPNWNVVGYAPTSVAAGVAGGYYWTPLVTTAGPGGLTAAPLTHGLAPAWCYWPNVVPVDGVIQLGNEEDQAQHRASSCFDAVSAISHVSGDDMGDTTPGVTGVTNKLHQHHNTGVNSTNDKTSLWLADQRWAQEQSKWDAYHSYNGQYQSQNTTSASSSSSKNHRRNFPGNNPKNQMVNDILSGSTHCDDMNQERSDVSWDDHSSHHDVRHQRVRHSGGAAKVGRHSGGFMGAQYM